MNSVVDSSGKSLSTVEEVVSIDTVGIRKNIADSLLEAYWLVKVVAKVTDLLLLTALLTQVEAMHTHKAMIPVDEHRDAHTEVVRAIYTHNHTISSRHLSNH